MKFLCNSYEILTPYKILTIKIKACVPYLQKSNIDHLHLYHDMAPLKFKGKVVNVVW
jgi:hypothetical protein